MRPVDAFEICHELYQKAREVIDNRLPTIRLDSHLEAYAWKPSRADLATFAADFALCGRRALGDRGLASRRVLFEVYYLGGAEYHAARKHLGISEMTWSTWADDIRYRVGRELLRAGLFPPSKYFREPTI